MTKSELIGKITESNSGLTHKESELLVNTVLDSMVDAMARGEGVELRGFGSFTLRQRQAREGRNPRLGTAVTVAAKIVPHFKPGKELRERVAKSR
ncbi:MAG: integration host factor subunit beta [Mariprofundales bacterium]|nr:integration host factor subunit beta [Mariprofundales bacterium]